MKNQKTYWHLLDLKHKPNEYDIATSRLLYYVPRGFEVNVPVAGWYRTWQEGSPLRGVNWEHFRDPRETTYTRYTQLQKTKEIFVDGLLENAESTGYDRSLSAAWLPTLGRILSPLRYPVHGLQMVAAYVGQMAPGGRIVIASLLQSADEMRRVQRLAYRLRQIQETHPGFGADGKEVWERDPLWQPLREAIEKLLVTYDWGEAFVALNLVIKPSLDELFLTHFARLATGHNDELLAGIFYSLNTDCTWHRDWSRALVELAVSEAPANREVIQEWIERWKPIAARAVAPFASLFESDVPQKIDRFCTTYWRSAGLDSSS